MDIANSDFSLLRTELIKKLTRIEEILKNVIFTFEQDRVQLLSDIDDISKRFSESVSVASTYFLNSILSEYTNHYKEISFAMHHLSSKRQGALIVIQREDLIAPLISQGTPIFAKISTPLLESIFLPESPLHAGAVLIQGDMIISAANVLPLTDQIFWDRSFNARELAAIGLSERSDALILLVFDNGLTSFCLDGHLYPFSTT
ncbi:diadenylate cyclase [Paenibacillus sepulcri]|uniref:Diadenylate cyclase n=1 Tax=Paenibacillus sepulcri TaxID=359917 RepID=A0ABS7BZ73_9BACL|nr:diadenylate cyclase [Paenibacillus sepulcri]